MPHAHDMLMAHPRKLGVDPAVLAACIEACFDCAQACLACADACLGEDMVADLVRCIRLNLDCDDVCDVTGRLLSRQTEPDYRVVRAQVEACRIACGACAVECERHAEHHEHCAICARACRHCEDSCTRLLVVLPA
jgi:hypothetical protein